MQKKLNKILNKSYSPYSNVKVAALLFTNDGKEYEGANIENATYTPTVCAERTAIFQAVLDGYKKGDFKEIHITSNTSNHLYPCGVCRQVMTEFFENDTKIHVWNNNIEEIFTLEELMPNSIQKKDLK